MKRTSRAKGREPERPKPKARKRERPTPKAHEPERPIAEGALLAEARAANHRTRAQRDAMASILEESRARFARAFFDFAPIGYALLDGNGNILVANHSFCELIGHVRSYAIGLPLVLWIDPDHRRDFLEHLRRCRESSGEEIVAELRMLGSDGDTGLPVHVISRRLSSHDQRFRSLTAIIDMTERQRIEDALRSSEAALKKAVEELDDRQHETEALTERLRRLAAEMSRVEQRERERIAGWMHDELQQVLVSAKIHVQLARRAASGQPAEILEVERLLDQALAASRSLAIRLSPPILRDGGLAPALRWLAGWMQEKDGLTVNVEYRGGEARPLPKDVRSFAFSAIREMLLNVVKHAKVSEAQVSVRLEGERLNVQVADTGGGFDEAKAEHDGREEHSGLFGLRERVRELGGSMRLDSEPGKGTRIELSLPISWSGERSGGSGVETGAQPS